MKKSSVNLSQPTNAAVVTYLAKIGTVALLTREGEVELASRIERGEGRVVRAILESPLALAELIALMDDLAAGKVAPRDVTRNTSDEEDEDVLSIAWRTAHDIITRATPLKIMLMPTSVPIAQAELDGH